jgi:hypothetical protein
MHNPRHRLAVIGWTLLFLFYLPPVAGACGPARAGYDETGVPCIPPPVTKHAAGLPVTGGLSLTDLAIVIAFVLLLAWLVVHVVQSARRAR